ncbi:helix-turn-helix transcriptional regulator [Flavobacterium sp. F-328]|uniref:Helix-turn-helix transcriptional regulator n=1 Tax=Flavobacterium erciyesense TaxID=2825842 RepID=A0ABS5D4Q0_9FLAO|nr:helix-turn-helix transcriptional regulator [Flavobacterium erciyesense]MBQ0909008.1 helix-turn-helix transcriptional regulator [Flavobacterium erciyesense]
MVNIEDFIKRLELLLDYYSLNASSFADKIGVQRSSLSHLLSGRNKPSLDFILKILEVYPEVDLYWILNGKGTFPASDKKQISSTLNEDVAKKIEETTLFTTDLFASDKEVITPKSEIKDTTSNTSIATDPEVQIDKIVVFYTDGSFKSYHPKL